MSFKSACFSRKRGKAEIITFIIYAVCLAVVMSFHEPWFDEAQAWLIARSASLKEILFEIPHYEGHPQLWHLILMPFAKLGAPYEFTMHAVNYVCILGAVALLLFRSPFPKIIRCLLPFNYFIFYQFGVLSRPYSLMTFTVMLAALLYPNRNKWPVRYILTLSLMCLTSAFGILMAGGLCILWTCEIIGEYNKEKKWNKVFSDTRLYALSGILVLAIFLAFSIAPAEDCYYDGSDLSFKEHLLVSLSDTRVMLIFPFDAFIGCALSQSATFLSQEGLLVEYIGGALVWIIMVIFLRENKKLALLLVPYGLQLFFAIFVYFSLHHVGASGMYIIFVFWQVFGDEEGVRIPPVFGKIRSKIDSVWTIRLGYVLVFVAAIASPAAAVVSSVNDIRYTYGMKEIATFIQENDLQDRKIMAIWEVSFSTPVTSDDVAGMQGLNKLTAMLDSVIWDETLPAEFPPLVSSQPSMNGIPTAVVPYFDKNIFMNYNDDDPDCLYMKWIDSSNNYQEYFDRWHDQGLPDVVIGLVDLDALYTEEELEGVTYYWVGSAESSNIFKFTHDPVEWKIYIRNDLLEEYPQFEIKKYATILNPDLAE